MIHHHSLLAKSLLHFHLLSLCWYWRLMFSKEINNYINNNSKTALTLSRSCSRNLYITPEFTRTLQSNIHHRNRESFENNSNELYISYQTMRLLLCHNIFSLNYVACAKSLLIKNKTTQRQNGKCQRKRDRARKFWMKKENWDRKKRAPWKLVWAFC